jgi:hypothetical protein
MNANVRIPLTTLLVTLALPAAAAQAAAPTVNTGGATQVTQTTANLHGTVNPQGQTTTYYFQYGPTTTYGSQTAPAAAGSGTKGVAALATVTGLSPATRYHYRIVASSPGGVTSGGDRSFVTDNAPLSLQLSATPNPVRFGTSTTLQGAIGGTGGGGRAVQIQQNAFPYTAGFANLGNPIVSSPDGTFASVVANLTVNAQFRAVTTQNPKLTSNVVPLGVAPVVRTAVSTHRPHKGGRVRFAGTVTPSWVPAQVAIQKRTGPGRWVTVAGSITHAFGSTKARYAKTIRVRRGGTYRVFVGLPNSSFAPTTGSSIKLRVR